jgi:hypothetical protein
MHGQEKEEQRKYNLPIATRVSWKDGIESHSSSFVSTTLHQDIKQDNDLWWRFSFVSNQYPYYCVE